MPEPLPTVLLTRPQDAAQAFSEDLRRAGVQADVLIFPVVTIEHLKPEPDFNRYSGAIFTSANGVTSVEGQNLTAWCVGPSTAQAARNRGWRAISADGDAQALVRRILADVPEGPLLHVRGERTRGDIAAQLTQSGFPADEFIAYRQIFQPLSEQARELLSREKPVILPLFSPLSARQVAKEAPFRAPCLVAAISQAVADESAPLNPEKLFVAAKPNAASMIEAVIRLMDAA